MISYSQKREVTIRENEMGGCGKMQFAPWFSAEDFGAKVRLCTEVTMLPGSRLGAHTHENEDEIYIIISGEGYVHDGEKWKRVVAGDSILTKHGESHAMENRGVEPLRFAAIIICY